MSEIEDISNLINEIEKENKRGKGRPKGSKNKIPPESNPLHNINKIKFSKTVYPHEYVELQRLYDILKKERQAYKKIKRRKYKL